MVVVGAGSEQDGGNVTWYALRAGSAPCPINTIIAIPEGLQGFAVLRVVGYRRCLVP